MLFTLRLFAAHAIPRQRANEHAPSLRRAERAQRRATRAFMARVAATLFDECWPLKICCTQRCLFYAARAQRRLLFRHTACRRRCQRYDAPQRAHAAKRADTKIAHACWRRHGATHAPAYTSADMLVVRATRYDDDAIRRYESVARTAVMAQYRYGSPCRQHARARARERITAVRAVAAATPARRRCHY